MCWFSPYSPTLQNLFSKPVFIRVETHVIDDTPGAAVRKRGHSKQELCNAETSFQTHASSKELGAPHIDLKESGAGFPNIQTKLAFLSLVLTCPLHVLPPAPITASPLTITGWYSMIAVRETIKTDTQKLGIVACSHGAVQENKAGWEHRHWYQWLYLVGERCVISPNNSWLILWLIWYYESSTWIPAFPLLQIKKNVFSHVKCSVHTFP